MNTISTKNLTIICVVVLVLLSVSLYFMRGSRVLQAPSGNQIVFKDSQVATPNNETQENMAVHEFVTKFGTELPKVSLLSPSSKTTMEEFYGPYVAPELLARWENDLSKAPGRQTSNPWPDHIEIGDIEKIPTGYIVRGQIVYMTSNELEHGGSAGVQDVTITLSNINNTLLITDFAAGQFGRGGSS